MRRRRPPCPDLSEALFESLSCYSSEWRVIRGELPPLSPVGGGTAHALAWLAWPGRQRWLDASPVERVSL